MLVQGNIPCTLRGRKRMSTQLGQIAKKAKTDPKVRFTSLAHLLTPEFLKETWKQMNRRGASGIDGETMKEFEQDLDTRVQELCERLKRGAYRAPPLRRVEIPKGPGKVGTRPLGIPTVEDRLLQRAVARILEAVFEADFLECSYGFRPGRNPHDALRALRRIIVTKKVGHLFEADIRGYFNHIQHEWLQKMVAHRIADPLILRLIGKWLNAGYMLGGVVTRTEEGSPQGGPISPILANIYLHHVLDLWFEKKIKPKCRGEAYLTRFADDFVGNFQYRRDAERFQQDLTDRFGKFGLELAEEKTRVMRFGRFVRSDLAKTGDKPDTFDFLGFKANLPSRSVPHTCLKPRKSNVSGLSPVFARSLRTNRPKRMTRVFSSANSSPNFPNRSVRSCWNRSASRPYWKLPTKSSANLVRYASPRHFGLIFFS